MENLKGFYQLMPLRSMGLSTIYTLKKDYSHISNHMVHKSLTTDTTLLQITRALGFQASTLRNGNAGVFCKDFQKCRHSSPE